MDVRYQDYPEFHLLGMLHRGPYHLIGPTFTKLFAIVMRERLFPPGTMALGAYHDDPGRVPAEELRSHAAITWTPGRPSPDPDLEVLTIPGGRFAVYTHRGAYDGLGPAWRKLVDEWFPQSGHSWRPSPCFEIYVNDMATTPVEELRTDLLIPV